MTIGRGPACFDCKHFEGPWQCAAFKRIPDEIAFEGLPHTTPYPGDNGIRFEPRPNVPAGEGS
jgi:hypothetical protein